MEVSCRREVVGTVLGLLVLAGYSMTVIDFVAVLVASTTVVVALVVGS